MKERILIVDDEQDTAELLRYNLDKAGYAAVTAQNGDEAIDAIQRNGSDLVLLDVMMPELNGWEVCSILRESSQGKTIPIIMLSALAHEEARIKGLGLGADDYIVKPFSVKELLLRVRKHLDRKQESSRFLDRQQCLETSLRYLVHELRNSMVVIGGYSSLALRKDDHRHYLETIKTSALHAGSLLNDAALLSRLEKDGSTMTLEPLDINLLTKEVIDIFEQTARRSNVEMVIANRASSLVLGNGTALRQVMINLVSNAIKYNHENGKVWIYFDETQNRIDVSITDEGRGISQAELPKIFDKYYRASGSEKLKGDGMGLYIVKLLMQAMAGTVKVVSNCASGSTFTFSLPLWRPGVPAKTVTRDTEIKSIPAAAREG